METFVKEALIDNTSSKIFLDRELGLLNSFYAKCEKVSKYSDSIESIENALINIDVGYKKHNSKKYISRSYYGC